MEIEVTKANDMAAVVALKGRLDLLSAPALKAQLAAAVTATPHLVIDLGDVSFIDSSGLGALISGLRSARGAGGDLRIAKPSDQARTILELTTLDRVLQPYPTLEEALAASHA